MPANLENSALASGQITGREHSPTHKQKIGWKIYWSWPNMPANLENSAVATKLVPEVLAPVPLVIFLKYFNVIRKDEILRHDDPT